MSRRTTVLSNLLSNAFGSLIQRPFRLERGEWGVKLAVTDAWVPSIATYVQTANVREVELNYANGFSHPGAAPEFLVEMSELHGLKITYSNFTDLAPVGELSALRLLVLTFSRSTRGLRLERLPRLEKLAFEWYVGADGLFALSDMRDLQLYAYPGKEGSGLFSALRVMRNLRLSACGLAEIDGLAAMTHLEGLELLAMAHLRSIEGLRNLTSLQRLRIEACKQVRSLEPLANLRALRHLSVSDCGEVASLHPLRGLKELERLELWGSTKIVDGDLQVIRELPKLRDVRFDNRRHYNMRREELAK